VVHGGNEWREGELSNAEDASGKSIAALAADVLRNGPSGTMFYHVLPAGDTRPREKISYVAWFAPWQVTFVAGAWVDDVEKSYTRHCTNWRRSAA
jgi:methyl-accepting chemotaxis protein